MAEGTKGLLGADNVLFLDLGAGYIEVSTQGT